MKLIVFDCDSTLSAIEGIDELVEVCVPLLGAFAASGQPATHCVQLQFDFRVLPP